MVEIIDSDIFSAPIDILCHGCNCQNVFGGGLALEVKKRFPEAYEADLKTLKGDKNKLGTYSKASVKDGSSRAKYIVNIYSQFKMSSGERETSYDALTTAFEYLERMLTSKGNSDLIVGVPYLLGCGLGRGNWKIVESILFSVFESSPVKLLICKHPVLHKNL